MKSCALVNVSNLDHGVTKGEVSVFEVDVVMMQGCLYQVPPQISYRDREEVRCLSRQGGNILCWRE